MGYDPRIIWDKNFDFSTRVQTYQDGTNFDEIAEKFSEYISSRNSSNVVRRNIDRSSLLRSQLIAHDVIVRMATRDFGMSRTDDNSSREFGRLLILCGQGGSGKSYTIDCILTTLRNVHDFSEKNYLILATTGMAATVISGYTCHNTRYGLSLPTRNKYSKLKGKGLKYK